MPASPATHSPAITHLPVQKIAAATLRNTEDEVVVEEPLEIRLQYGPANARHEQTISVTMRTPGQDTELATGFLFTEGIIRGAKAVRAVRQGYNSILFELQEDQPVDLGKLQRHFYTSSSCGVCGKTSIDALKTICPAPRQDEEEPLEASLLYSLPDLLRQQQNIFDSTGGLHAAALFDRQGRLTTLREDIGRHNALDKLIGYSLQQDRLPLSAVLLSGRACFELIQKAAMAGMKMVAAIGPPSSLAIQLAEEQGMTLIGFLRDQRFNIYTGSHRVRV
jgi:FdhD protein